MGFPHCPICVALAFLSFCLVVTRVSMFFFLYKESLKRRVNIPLIFSIKLKYLIIITNKLLQNSANSIVILKCN